MNTTQAKMFSLKPFQLFWMIGFSGKRFIDPRREAEIRSALRRVVGDLVLKAATCNARLSAISSLARGGDVLFAETALEPSAPTGPLPWKCLLPFNWDAFIRLDMEVSGNGDPLLESDSTTRIGRAKACLDKSFSAPEIASPIADPADKEQREEAYLECGYRVVDESDVMIFLLRSDEYETLRKFPLDTELKPAATHRPGTFAVACYAFAASRPMVILNADAENVDATIHILHAPGSETNSGQWFVDPIVTDIILKASSTPLETDPLLEESAQDSPENRPVARADIAAIGARLGVLANRHQSKTRNDLRRILRCHLAASALAAIAVTVLAVAHPETVPTAFLAALAVLSFMKPGLAFAAWWMEHRLHHGGTREVWLNARVLSELCRSAVATWPLPLQSISVRDEEVFPKVKRLIRTLRLLREQDARAAVSGTPRQACETQVEADMRRACAIYAQERLQDQALYYAAKHKQALREEHNWRRRFQAATWIAISAGLALALDRFVVAAGGHLLYGIVEKTLEATIIIAPFLAAHCLSMMTILDTRRRCRRYSEMSDSLNRLTKTLGHTEANPSRVRLVEHAERTLIEEQHEWLSVMRNLSI